MDLRDKNLALIMTRSVDRWSKVAGLSRELKPYTKLSSVLRNILIFSYASGRSGLEHELPGNVHVIPRPVFIPATIYMFLMPLIHARYFRTVDIIKTNQMDGSWAAVISKRLFKKKLVVRCGYEWLNYFKTTNAPAWKQTVARIIERWSYVNADRIIITSKADKEFIVRAFGIPEARIEVIGNYIDTDLFVPDNSVVKDADRIMFVGRLHEDKNLSMLIESLIGLTCELVVAGHGPEASRLISLAASHGVQFRMLGTVTQEQLPKELTKSTIFILPSRSEGNPKALLEAMACGLPCIGTNVKGIREVISSGENGILVEPSSESLRSAILSILENPELRDRLGRNAREEIVRNYSLEVVLKKEKEIYENLV